MSGIKSQRGRDTFRASNKTHGYVILRSAATKHLGRGSPPRCFASTSFQLSMTILGLVVRSYYPLVSIVRWLIANVYIPIRHDEAANLVGARYVVPYLAERLPPLDSRFSSSELVLGA